MLGNCSYVVETRQQGTVGDGPHVSTEKRPAGLAEKLVYLLQLGRHIGLQLGVLAGVGVLGPGGEHVENISGDLLGFLVARDVEGRDGVGLVKEADNLVRVANHPIADVEDRNRAGWVDVPEPLGLVVQVDEDVGGAHTLENAGKVGALGEGTLAKRLAVGRGLRGRKGRGRGSKDNHIPRIR